MAFLNRELKDIMKVVKENLQYESNIHKINNNNYSLVNSNNIYRSNQGKLMSKRKSNSKRNMLFGNNMVKIVDENSNTNKNNNSGQSFNLFNILNSNKNQQKNKPRFQNRAFNKKEIKFDLGQNLIGPEVKALAVNKKTGKNNNTTQITKPLEPKPQPVEGFLPPNMKGLEFLPKTNKAVNNLGNNLTADCESIGNDLSGCKLNPKCRFDYANQKCVNK